MTKKLDPQLTQLAAEIMEGHGVEIYFDKGCPIQAQLLMSWDKKTGFNVYLTIYTEGQTWPATREQPEETEWHEQVHETNARKITEVARWLDNFGFTDLGNQPRSQI